MQRLTRRTTAASYAALAALALAASAAAAAGGDSTPLRKAGRASQQSTRLISRALDGGLPNGPSTHPAISGDRRWARLVAFQSEASNLVRRDTNGFSDVFVVRRAGSIRNNGSGWTPKRAVLVSRGLGGQPANGPSFSPTLDGAFKRAPKCMAFLSAASNLVKGDTNGKVDAFLSSRPGRHPRRISLPRRRQATEDTTAVAVSGDCSRIAFVTGGRLYVRRGRRVRRVRARGPVTDPSFTIGISNDLVFAARRGVYLSRDATRRPKLVGPGGRNPSFNDIFSLGGSGAACKRPTVAYERKVGSHWQIVTRQLGRKPRIVSRRRGKVGNGDSRHPTIANAGCYVTFETDAGNLGVNANGEPGDYNRAPDVYLFTAVRQLTLVQSVRNKAVPISGGGRNPGMSYYANYIVFDAPAPLRDQGYVEPRRGEPDPRYIDPLPPGPDIRPRQIYMRYLGPA
ncbi:MAG TPA: hypothetical protein VF545_06480 [Thermoleophilaceae bacterium]